MMIVSHREEVGMAGPFAIGFLGAGQMATALAKGWAKAGLLDPTRSRASDPSMAARSAFELTGIPTSAVNVDVAKAADVIVLAVKPQMMAGVLAEVKPVVSAHQLVISIAAGWTLKALAAGLASGTRIVRVMPNTPCLVGASAAAYSAGANATADDQESVHRLLAAVGTATELPEHLLDAVTGLSGSGPGYVFVLIEALADGGVKAGLPRNVAQALAAQTVFGAAKMVLETGQHPAALKDAVASPAGTTIAGLAALERGGFRAALIEAVVTATERAAELGKKT
ncbi:MAG TPA: pyrroline-5-carboxylate reductase [Fimbriiglobus sp.]|jgi:pyrroline-5-carboxylate reductase